MIKNQKGTYTISDLLDIMARLRDPERGCPWDRQQDFRSIAPYTIEEAYEVADAIERDALNELPDELGDLLLQVVFHAQMATEAGAFDFTDVVTSICAKLLRRHPHVFGSETAPGSDDPVPSWEQAKRDERAQASPLLSGIPTTMPALTRAQKVGRRAAGVGFDWPEYAPVRAKVSEELDELDTALSEGSRERIAAELGDVFFALVNLSRHLGIDSEQCLRDTISRFTRRFSHVETSVAAAGGRWEDFDPAALERLWEAAKRSESE